MEKLNEEDFHNHVAIAEDAFVKRGFEALEEYIDTLRGVDNLFAIVIRATVIARDALTQAMLDSYLEEDGQD